VQKGIYRRRSLTDLLGEQVGGEVWDPFTVHYTPKHGSWLSQAEIEIDSLRTLREKPSAESWLGSNRQGDNMILRAGS
jgi:hypothetical protein